MWHRPHLKESPATTEVGVQDDLIVLQRWRELAKTEGQRASESLAAAREATAALDLQIQEVAELRSFVEDAGQLWSTTRIGAPVEKEVFVENGRCWHLYRCRILEQVDPSNVQPVKGCSFCSEHQCPPDRYHDPAGWCIRHDISMWRQDAQRCVFGQERPV